MAIINVRDIHDDLDRCRDLDSELALIEAKDIIQRLRSTQPGTEDHLAAFTDAVDHLIEERYVIVRTFAKDSQCQKTHTPTAVQAPRTRARIEMPPSQTPSLLRGKTDRAFPTRISSQ